MTTTTHITQHLELLTKMMDGSTWEHDYPLLSMTDEQLTNAFHPVMEIL